ncbi:hypothetical protein L7F22_026054 [Adiantum nelumboides]|nr:hypothetical protein [Adiantum nelumboides]
MQQQTAASGKAPCRLLAASCVQAHVGGRNEVVKAASVFKTVAFWLLLKFAKDIGREAEWVGHHIFAKIDLSATAFNHPCTNLLRTQRVSSLSTSYMLPCMLAAASATTQRVANPGGLLAVCFIQLHLPPHASRAAATQRPKPRRDESSSCLSKALMELILELCNLYSSVAAEVAHKDPGSLLHDFILHIVMGLSSSYSLSYSTGQTNSLHVLGLLLDSYC